MENNLFLVGYSDKENGQKVTEVVGQNSTRLVELIGRGVDFIDVASEDSLLGELHYAMNFSWFDRLENKYVSETINYTLRDNHIVILDKSDINMRGLKISVGKRDNDDLFQLTLTENNQVYISENKRTNIFFENGDSVSDIAYVSSRTVDLNTKLLASKSPDKEEKEHSQSIDIVPTQSFNNQH